MEGHIVRVEKYFFLEMLHYYFIQTTVVYIDIYHMILSNLKPHYFNITKQTDFTEEQEIKMSSSLLKNVDSIFSEGYSDYSLLSSKNIKLYGRQIDVTE